MSEIQVNQCVNYQSRTYSINKNTKQNRPEPGWYLSPKLFSSGRINLRGVCADEAQQVAHLVIGKFRPDEILPR